MGPNSIMNNAKDLVSIFLHSGLETHLYKMDNMLLNLHMPHHTSFSSKLA